MNMLPGPPPPSDPQEHISQLLEQQRADRHKLNVAHALLRGVEAMQLAQTADAVLAASADTLRRVTQAQEVFVFADLSSSFHASIDRRFRQLIPPPTDTTQTRVPHGLARWLAKRKRVADLSETSLREHGSSFLPTVGSLISIPYVRADAKRIVIGCWHPDNDFFSEADFSMLQKVSDLSAHSLNSLQHSDRHSLLANVIENSVIPTMLFEPYDRGSTIIFVNRAFEQMSGKPSSDFIGQSFLSDRVQSGVHRDRMQEAIEKGVAGRFKVWVKPEDRDPFLDEITLTPIADKATNEVRYMLATHVDLTQEIKARREVRRLEDHIDSAMEAVTSAIMVTDPKGDPLYSNSVMRDLTKELYGADLNQSEAQTKFAQRSISSRSGFELNTADRLDFVVRTFATREGGYVVTGTDVTEIRRAEKILKQRAAAMDSTAEGIAIVEKDATITYANPAFAAISGASSPEEIIGTSWCRTFCSEDVARLPTEVRPKVEQEGSAQLEMRVCRDDNETDGNRTFDVCITRIDGNARIVVARDITRRIEYETTRANLEQKLHDFEKHEAISRLAAGVAHDFNNLLAVINGHAALLNARTPVDKVQLYSDRIAEASSRAAKMINRFLDLGMSTDSHSMIDLRNLVTESQDLLGSALSADTKFDLEMTEQELEMLCYPSDLLRVALNLVQNAQDAMEGKPGHIRQKLERHMGVELLERDFNSGIINPEQLYACYSVTDTGSGMPEEIRQRLFREHCSTKGQRGSGIGMMAIAEIVRNHEGALRVLSEQGKGTTVEVYLPLSDIALTQIGTTEIGSVRLEKQLVLVVDDDAQVADSIGAFLERLGAEVCICTDPNEALDAIKEDPGIWSFLISDYNMPGQNGGQLAKAVKQVDPALPIVIVTALARKLSDPNLNETVIDALLAKPVDLNSLAHLIAQKGRPIGADGP